MNNLGIKALVADLLEHPHSRAWTVQGLGMLRSYLNGAGAPKEYRLHVWDESLVVPHVSTMHTHPWDLHSLVIAGRLMNVRFETAPVESSVFPAGGVYNRQAIRCGEGGGLEGDPDVITLYQQPAEIYGEGDVYTQTAHEIHVSLPDSGTVTMIKRSFGEDTEHAYVFWGPGEEWVSAEPRPATIEEIDFVTKRALERWF